MTDPTPDLTKPRPVNPNVCPFCGDEHVEYLHKGHLGGSGVCVECGMCSARGPLAEDMNNAAKMWNDVAPPPGGAAQAPNRGGALYRAARGRGGRGAWG
jgi:hypothetical protein